MTGDYLIMASSALPPRNAANNYVIKIETYSINVRDTIGKGAYGIVYKGTDEKKQNDCSKENRWKDSLKNTDEKPWKITSTQSSKYC